MSNDSQNEIAQSDDTQTNVSIVENQSHDPQSTPPSDTYSLNIFVPYLSTSSPSQLKSSKIRNQIFYDEEISVYFQLNGVEIESLVDSITIAVEVKIIGLTPQNQTQNIQRERKHTIFSQIVNKSNLIQASSDNAIWMLNIPITHPRSRLLRPNLVIDSVVKLSNGSSAAHDDSSPKPSHITKSKYIQELVPITQENLFEALSFGESNSLSKSVLDNTSATITTTTTTITSSSTTTSTIITSPQLSTSPHLNNDDNDLQLASAELTIPVFPALNLRLRCSILTGGNDNETLIASIELTCGETAKVDVLISSVSLQLTDNSSVSQLGPIRLPQWLRPGENLVLCYRMDGVDTPSTTTGRAVPVTINVSCYPAMNGSEINATSNSDISTIQLNSLPNVKTKWDTTVDFDHSSNSQTPTIVQNPLLNNTDNVPMRRAGRPLNRTASNISLNNSTRNTRPPLTNLTLSFTGPSAVKVGEKFSWNVFVVNKSPLTRNLTLFFQSRETPYSPDKSTFSPITNIYDTNTYPIIERPILKRIANTRSLQDKGIVSLVNDVRIGPLQPQACFETTITLLALSPGIHTLGDSTLVDLSNGQGYDCGPLLEVVVSK